MLGRIGCELALIYWSGLLERRTFDYTCFLNGCLKSSYLDQGWVMYSSFLRPVYILIKVCV